jgi:hypothetical protein
VDIKLTRKAAHLYGVLGELTTSEGVLVCVTLEHAYASGDIFLAKLAPGTYTCKRGVHKLSNLNPFEAFEVQNVPWFQGAPVSGILLHKGNYNKDSEGCILLGSKVGLGCILDSGAAFDKFMALQDGVNEFTLEVIS